MTMATLFYPGKSHIKRFIDTNDPDAVLRAFGEGWCASATDAAAQEPVSVFDTLDGLVCHGKVLGAYRFEFADGQIVVLSNAQFLDASSTPHALARIVRQMKENQA